MRELRSAVTCILVVLCAAGLFFAQGKGAGRPSSQPRPAEKRKQPPQQQAPQDCKNDAANWSQLAEIPNSPGILTYFLRQDLDGDKRFECVRLKFKNTKDAPVKFEGAWTLDTGKDVKAKPWSFVLGPGESTVEDAPDLLTCLSTQSMVKNQMCKPGIKITSASVTQPVPGDAKTKGGGR